jgi:membrane protein implicated in regulation of membrane protease activity
MVAMALVWVIVGVALLIAEVLSGDFVLVMLGLAALLGAATAALVGGFTASLVASLVVFGAASAGLIAGVRPMLKQKVRGGEATATNAAALVGRRAVSTTAVTHNGGRVKIGGEIWSARTVGEADVIEPGRSVSVVEISGATAIVVEAG